MRDNRGTMLRVGGVLDIHLHVRSVMLVFLLLMASLSAFSASALDTDGDGVEDHLDYCPLAAGNSTTDRDGCPDADGDGISDWTDRWTIPNTPFLNLQTMTSSQDYNTVDHSPDGKFVVSGDESGWVRIWNTSTQINVLSAQISNDVAQVAWSEDGSMIAASTNRGNSADDELHIWWAENMSVRHSTINVDVESGNDDTPGNLAFNHDGSLIAVAIGRAGNSGTNGEVKIINTSSGIEEQALNPNSEDRFDSVAWSPDGSRIALGGNGDIWIYETVNWQENDSLTGIASGTVNDMAWSPDGNYLSVCEGWGGSNSKASVVDVRTGEKAWPQKSHTSSCLSTDFSPDSRMVAYSISYYQADAGTVRIYTTDYGADEDTIDSCPSNNNCAQVNGISWASDGQHIVTGNGRDDEGLYFWHIAIDPDQDGWNTTDQGDGKVDQFPSENSQWNDSDMDGYGDNPAPASQPDACIYESGTSYQDRFGCPDQDGDGYSDQDPEGEYGPIWTLDDGADAFIEDPEQWEDADEDGYGDNYKRDIEDGTLLHTNQRGDFFPNNPTQWNDSDGDTWGDNFANLSWLDVRPVNESTQEPEWPGIYDVNATRVDQFPLDRYQWMDSDGDWVGDQPFTPRSDACPNLWGDSYEDRLGCPDRDGDGWSDPDGEWEKHPDGDADAFPDDPSQWRDTDGDGYGDNASGTNPDDCTGEAGQSYEDRVGCPDMDGDGWSNGGDAMPVDPTQWQDRDGDGYGDNMEGNNPDAFPDDSTQWSDSDGDGYGDNPIGLSGDWFPDDPTQWHDFDGDEWGDNPNGTRGDACPGETGPKPKSSSDEGDPATRGCPDRDADGVPDPIDAFPDDPFQWEDSDGDGWGDSQAVPNGDDCIDVPGNSSKSNLQGCPDADRDGWADEIDEFPNDSYQWSDRGGDGWGDNYIWENSTSNYTMDGFGYRIQMGDAYPDDSTQWSNVDGDVRGDNPNGVAPDAFPLVFTQMYDTDNDGYGDNFTLGAYQPDDCSWAGSSWRDRFGCTDSDEDGQSDDFDSCPWDPEIWEFKSTGVDCGITEDPSKESDDKSSVSGLGALVDNRNLLILGAIIAFLLLAVLIAQISKQAARRSGRMLVTDEGMEEMLVERAEEEEARKQQWIDYYLQTENKAKAKELGWEDPEDLPEWKRHEMEQAKAKDEAMPTMVDIEELF